MGFSIPVWFKQPLCLRDILLNVKDPVPAELRARIVYCITCGDCCNSYDGQTRVVRSRNTNEQHLKETGTHQH